MNPHYPFVAMRARHVCEYCRAPEVVFNLPFEVEHITPQARGGATIDDNLALSCRSCNLYKSDSVAAFDEVTRRDAPLFNPRRDVWREHFSTIKGRATIFRLHINSDAQIKARRRWMELGFEV